jgi:hypothetical protein
MITDEFLNDICEKLNKLINIPFLNEDQEKRLIFFIISLVFDKLNDIIKKDEQRLLDL